MMLLMVAMLVMMIPVMVILVMVTLKMMMIYSLEGSKQAEQGGGLSLGCHHMGGGCFTLQLWGVGCPSM